MRIERTIETLEGHTGGEPALIGRDDSAAPTLSYVTEDSA